MALARRNDYEDFPLTSSGAPVKGAKTAGAVFICFLVTTLSPVAFADGRPGAQVIYFGQARAPGVKASAVNFQASASAMPSDKEVMPNALASASAGTVPAPVSLSAHNCIPRTDARGVSLAFEFVESGVADCVSFVSPPPPPPDPGRPRPKQEPRPSPETLAQAAFDRVISLAPSPELDVAPGRIGLTGLPSFFWVGNELAPVTATAGVRGLTVTAEARPAAYRWDFDDGTTRTTQHGGRPWTRQRDGNVGHLYETKGRYQPAVTVTWAARWRINGGAWRDLGYFSTTDAIEYRVREMVAALVRRR